MRLLHLLGFFLLAGTFLGPRAEGWAPIGNVQANVVQQVGRFAVIVYSLTHKTDLEYVNVLRGETEHGGGGGTNYRLVVTAARPDGSASQYQCLVWGVPGSRSNTWKLLQFRRI